MPITVHTSDLDGKILATSPYYAVNVTSFTNPGSEPKSK